MSVSPADVLVIAPEFSTLLSATIQLFIDDAVQSVHAESWGSKADIGVKYLTAHRLLISFPDGTSGGGGGGSGTITKEKVGDLERTYASPSIGSSGSLGDQLLATTKYGQIFLSIQEEVPGGPMVITQGLNQSGVLV